VFLSVLVGKRKVRGELSGVEFHSSIVPMFHEKKTPSCGRMEVMAHPDLIAYIRKETQEGIAAQELRIALMEAGWQERDIDNALHDVAAGLQPITYGASIHEDLAQVRGMVAHLALRVKELEAHMAISAPVQRAELPSGEMLSLSKGHGPSFIIKVISAAAVIVLIASVGFLFSTSIVNDQESSRSLLWVAAGTGAVLFGVAYFLMRRGNAWAADLAAASSVAAWSLSVWHAWRAYHVLEDQTAIGLYVLLFVLLVVMGRWIDRLSR
jgi:hypothetical protein